MSNELAIQLNHSLQNLIHLHGYRDTDEFGLRLSEELAYGIRAGLPPHQAIPNALSSTRTTFFRANGLSKAHFAKRVSGSIGPLLRATAGLEEPIRSFCEFDRRQLASELWKNRNDESVLRSHLQTSLESTGRRTLKEVTTGRGRADIVLLDGESREVIETKIWKGNEYFQEGLVELAEYLRTEGIGRGHCVVLDCSKDNQLTSSRGIEWSEQVNGTTILVWFVKVSPEAPSRLRRTLRRPKV